MKKKLLLTGFVLVCISQAMLAAEYNDATLHSQTSSLTAMTLAPMRAADSPPFANGEKLSDQVYRFKLKLGGTKDYIFMRRSQITSNHRYVLMRFDDAKGAAVWDVQEGKSLDDPTVSEIIIESVASTGLLGGQLKGMPMVGTPGNWKNLKIDENRYGSVEALSDNGRYAAGWSCINDSQAMEALVWDLEQGKSYPLPLPTTDEFAVHLNIPRPCSISNDGKVVLGSAQFSDREVAILWRLNESTGKYQFTDIMGDLCDYVGGESEATVIESFPAAMSMNGEWVCGTYRGRVPGVPDFKEITYHGFAYHVPTGRMTLVYYVNPEDAKDVWPVQMFGISDSGILVGAQADFGSVYWTEPLYADVSKGIEKNLLLSHGKELMASRNVADYKFGDYGAILEAISPDGKMIVAYEIADEAGNTSGEEIYNKEMTLFYFTDAITDVEALAPDAVVRVYPTLVEDHLVVTCNASSQPLVRIYDLNGVLVYEHRMAQSVESLSLEHLTRGRYIVSVGGRTQQIVKQ